MDDKYSVIEEIFGVYFKDIKIEQQNENFYTVAIQNKKDFELLYLDELKKWKVTLVIKEFNNHEYRISCTKSSIGLALANVMQELHNHLAHCLYLHEQYFEND